MLLGLLMTLSLSSQNRFPYPDPSLNYQDSLFRKIILSFSLTGTEQPAGKPDIPLMDESYTSFPRLLWYLNGLTSDEAINPWEDEDLPDLIKHSWDSENRYAIGMYNRLYFIILQSNKYLKSTGTINVNNGQSVQVKFFRALAYSYLIDLFDVLWLIPEHEPFIPFRISRADLLNHTLEQLKTIESVLPDPGEASYYLADQATNWLLQARLYLNAGVYNGTDSISYDDKTNWDMAAYFSNKVIGSSYKLNASYKQLFMADNAGIFDGSVVNTAPKEILLAIPCDGINAKSWGNSMFYIASTSRNDMHSRGINDMWSGFTTKSTLIRTFFPGAITVTDLQDLTTGFTSPASRYCKDDRALFWAQDRTIEQMSDGIRFVNGYSTFKWTNIRADGQITNDQRFTDTDIPLFRKAEAYLIYAEARLRGASGNLEAIEAINELRTRAHAKLFTSTITLNTIIDEWAREFHFEGRRRSDLIRFNKFGGDTVSYKWTLKGGVFEGAGIPLTRNTFELTPALTSNILQTLINSIVSGIETASSGPYMDIRIENKKLHLKFTHNTPVYIYNSMGKTVGIALTSPSTVSLPAAGVYILKQNSQFEKIIIQ